MKKRLIMILLVLVVTLSLISCKNDEKKEDNDIFSGARFVRTVKVFTGDIEQVYTYSGFVNFDNALDIVPVISGKIEKIFVIEGDHVKKNQLLARIDQNSLEQYEAGYNLADRNYKRAQNLLKEKAIDLKSYEEIENMWINARTSYDFAKENLEVKAPISGIITNVNMKENENYTPMLAGLFRIVGEGGLSIDVSVSDKDVRVLRLNQKVRIKAGNDTYDGKISFISPENSRLTGLNSVKVSLNNNQHFLRNNQFVLVDFIPAHKESVLIIPKKALINDDTVILMKNNKSFYQKVQTGMMSRHYVEIISGLNKGDIVITEGNSGLENNYPVTEFNN